MSNSVVKYSMLNAAHSASSGFCKVKLQLQIFFFPERTVQLWSFCPSPCILQIRVWSKPDLHYECFCTIPPFRRTNDNSESHSFSSDFKEHLKAMYTRVRFHFETHNCCYISTLLHHSRTPQTEPFENSIHPVLV